MKKRWIGFLMILSFAAPCAAEDSIGRDLRSGLKQLGTQMDHMVVDFMAWVKAPPKTTLEQDAKAAGRTIEKALDSTAKTIRKWRK